MCTSCNATVADDAKFCNNCGAQVTAPTPTPTLATAPATSNFTKFCASCGSGLVATAVVCPKCGTAQRSFNSAGGKSKTVGVVLAVFLSAWTWCYTYSADAKKFWTAAGLWALVVILWILGITSAVHSGYTCDQFNNCTFHNASGASGFFIFAGLINTGIYVWAIVDRAIKPPEFYSAL